MIKGYLGKDAESGIAPTGGLIIHKSNVQIVTPGHPNRCGCKECIDKWNSMAAARNEEQQRRLRENLGPEWFAASEPEGTEPAQATPPSAPAVQADVDRDHYLRDDQGRPMYDLDDPHDAALAADYLAELKKSD